MTAQSTQRPSKSSASLLDRIERLAGGVGRNRQGLDPTGCARLAREPLYFCKNVKPFENRYQGLVKNDQQAFGAVMNRGGDSR